MIYYILEGAVMFLGGLYGTLLGFRIAGKKPGADPKWDAWYEKFGRHLKWLGPALMVFAILLPLLRTR